MDREQAEAAVPALEARSLTKRYGGFRAVREVSFSIRPGELLGVVGPNGAGKSTIVRMLTGLTEPTAGSVLFRGQPIASDLGDYKRNLGYVPETPDLYGFLTGWERGECSRRRSAIGGPARRPADCGLFTGSGAAPGI